MIRKTLALLMIGFLIVGCSSKTSTFYVLNPLPLKKFFSKPYRHLRIGIDEVNSPDYMDKPQLIIRTASNQLKLEEYHRWAGQITKNIGHVIETNLSTLLPGAVVEISPWDANFQPTHRLQVEIRRFEVDVHGNSRLRAEFIIYAKDKIRSKKQVSYHTKINQVTYHNMVTSMNHNLTRLSRDIAKQFKK